MTEREFRKYLRRGRGKCYTYLVENRGQFKRCVKKACVKYFAFDAQCEGTRAKYLYLLLKTYGDDGYFLPKIIREFAKCKKSLNWEFEHLCDLVALFAADGDKTAADALEDFYAKNIVLLKKKPRGYDFDRDRVERVAVALIQTGGESALEKIARDFNGLFLSGARDSEDFDWLMFYIANNFDGATIKRLAPESFVEKLPERKQFAAKRGAPSPAPLNGGNCDGGLIDSVMRLKPTNSDRNGWHEKYIELINELESGKNAPKEVILHAYENGLCACCRRSLHRILAARGWLDGEREREYNYDSFYLNGY